MYVIGRVSNSYIPVIFISGKYVVILVKKSNSVQSGIENFNFRPPSHSLIHPGAAALPPLRKPFKPHWAKLKKQLNHVKNI